MWKSAAPLVNDPLLFPSGTIVFCTSRLQANNDATHSVRGLADAAFWPAHTNFTPSHQRLLGIAYRRLLAPGHGVRVRCHLLLWFHKIISLDTQSSPHHLHFYAVPRQAAERERVPSAWPHRPPQQRPRPQRHLEGTDFTHLPPQSHCPPSSSPSRPFASLSLYDGDVLPLLPCAESSSRQRRVPAPTRAAATAAAASE